MYIDCTIDCRVRLSFYRFAFATQYLNFSIVRHTRTKILTYKPLKTYAERSHDLLFYWDAPVKVKGVSGIWIVLQLPQFQSSTIEKYDETIS